MTKSPAQHCQLQIETAQVEQLGGDVFGSSLAGQAGNMRTQVAQRSIIEIVPDTVVGEADDIFTLGAHDEVVLMHRRHFAMQLA
ncbi:hypothetical protein M2318_005480 [Metapseudomonas resinovorans]|uniref:hypothetical protein n=1 Tax=Metapseudomonas resinovorans TaxID=53412 RepID=UPI003D25C142